jgi:hypothetical protein
MAALKMCKLLAWTNNKLCDFKANNDNYSLLMYVVDLIDKNYNECKDWIAVFNDCKECSKTKMRD